MSSSEAPRVALVVFVGLLLAGATFLLLGFQGFSAAKQREQEALDALRVAEETALQAEFEAAPTPEIAGEEPGRVEAPGTGVRVDESRGEPARFVVLVEDGEGTPVAGARVALCDPQWVDDDWFRQPEQRAGETGVDGRISFADAPPKCSEIVAFAPRSVPVLVARESGASEQRVVVDGDVSLGGVARVDGFAPGERLEFDVRGFRDPTVDWSPAVRRALSEWKYGDSHTRLFTQADGEFELRGLPEGDVVSITCPDAYRFRAPTQAAAPRDFQARVPSSEILLDLVSLPVIRGRPVDAEAEHDGRISQLGSAVPGKEIRIDYRFRRGGHVARAGQLQSSIGQVFEIPFHQLDFEGVEIDLVAGHGLIGGEMLAKRELILPLTESYDFGDIRVDKLRGALQILVLDSAGSPIEGAQAFLSSRQSEPTGVDGRTELEMRPADTRIMVAALGFAAVSAPVPESPPLPFVVTLPTANRLEVTVRTPDGTPPTGLQVTLHFSSTLDYDSPEANGGLAALRGPVPSGGAWSSSERTHYYPLDPIGVYARFDFPPGETFTLGIEDAQGNTLHTEKLALAAEEHRTVDVLLARSARTIRGTVVDASGTPLPNARISFGSWFGDDTTTDDQGAFAVDSVYTEKPDVYVDLEGYVTKHYSGAELYEGARIELEPARTVWVEVLDASGQRTSADVRIETPEGESYGGSERGTGMYQFQGIPLRAATVRAWLDSDLTPVASPLDGAQTQARVQFAGR